MENNSYCSVIDNFKELIQERACLNAPHPYSEENTQEIIEFENAAYLQGFSDAIKLMVFLP